MSDRGSYITSYVHCAHCLLVLNEYLSNHTGKRLTFNGELIINQDFDRGEHPPAMIGGYLNEGYPGEVFTELKAILPKLRKKLCHDVQLCIIPEQAKAKIYKIKGKNKL
jgi:hypothetical protein